MLLDKKIFVNKCPMEGISVRLSSLKEKSENVGNIYSTTDHDHCGQSCQTDKLKQLPKIREMSVPGLSDGAETLLTS